MDFFDVNFDLLRVQLLPVRLRRDNMKAWLKCCIYPVIWLYNLFRANRTSNLYELAHNSQVVYLEAALNDVFDLDARRITVEDGAYLDPLFTFQVPEARPVWTGLASEAGLAPWPVPQALYTQEETDLNGNGFVVKVPASLSFDLERMRALINKYRTAGRAIYQVITY